MPEDQMQPRCYTASSCPSHIFQDKFFRPCYFVKIFYTINNNLLYSSYLLLSIRYDICMCISIHAVIPYSTVLKVPESEICCHIYFVIHLIRITKCFKRTMMG